MTGAGINQDFKKAVNCFSKAGDPRSLYHLGNFPIILEINLCYLGLLYDTGLGVDQDAEKALEYFTKAASEGSTEAQNRLGTSLPLAISFISDI